MTDHKHIIDAFENYLASERPGFAMMISGDWGVGKTHFWSTTLGPYVESRHRHCVLVSLYGVRTQEEFEKQVIASIYPFLDWKFLKTAKAALDKWLGFGLSLFTLSPKLHKAVFCFDDFERLDMTPEVALGYINRFIELYGSHVLILANEGRVDGQKYWEMKEKVVGKTYQFVPDIAVAMKSIVSNLGVKKHPALEARIPIIQSAVIKSSTLNLRSAILAVDNCNLVLKRLESQPELPSDALDAILRMVAICTLQEKNDKKVLQHIRALLVDPKGWYFLAYARKEAELEDSPLSFVEEFANRYFDGNTDLIPPLIPLLDLVELGWFDVELLHSQALKLVEPKKTESDDLKRLFLKDLFLIPSDVEVLKIAKEYLEQVKRHDIRNATDLSIIFFALEFLSEQGMLEESAMALTDVFKKSIGELSDAGIFQKRDFAEFIGLSRFVEPCSENLKVVVNALALAKEQVDQKGFLQRIDNLLIEMENDYESFLSRIMGNFDGDDFDYAHKPLFASMKPDDVLTVLASKQPKEIRLFESLIRQRYFRVANVNEFLADERDFLLALAVGLERAQLSAAKTMCGVALGMLKSVVEKAASRVAA